LWYLFGRLDFTEAPGIGVPVFEFVILPVTSVWAKIKDEDKRKLANNSHFLISADFWSE